MRAKKEPRMGAPYSQDLRDRVLAACDRGMKTGQVAKAFAVCSSWVRRIKQRRRETGQTTPRPMGGATVVKIDGQRLRELVRQQPDATLKELRERLGGVCVESAVCMALKRLGLPLKKSRSTPRSRTARMSQHAASSGSKSSLGSTRGG
jgi:transposase